MHVRRRSMRLGFARGGLDGIDLQSFADIRLCETSSLHRGLLERITDMQETNMHGGRWHQAQTHTRTQPERKRQSILQIVNPSLEDSTVQVRYPSYNPSPSRNQTNLLYCVFMLLCAHSKRVLLGVVRLASFTSSHTDEKTRTERDQTKPDKA